ncbi:MAG: hypothetical protein ACI4EW_09690 [Butyrivibrio sp.]
MKLRKFFAALLAGIMAVSTMAVAAFAEEEVEIGVVPTDAYYAYVGVQSNTYVFRDQCDSDSYGVGSKEFDQITYWEGQDALDSGMDISEGTVKLDGNGRYTIKIKDTKFKQYGSETFNMLYISTNIPYADADKITIDGWNVTIGGTWVTNSAKQATEKDSPNYFRYMIINEYDDKEGDDGSAPLKGSVNNNVPEDGSEIVIEFTVSGMDHDNPDLVPEETTEAATEAAAADSDDKSNDESGSGKILGLPTPAFVGIIAGVVVIVVIIISVVAAGKKKKAE